jgi:hypothetical protein
MVYKYINTGNKLSHATQCPQVSEMDIYRSLNGGCGSRMNGRTVNNLEDSGLLGCYTAF